MNYIIYTLKNPENDDIRYIGYTGKSLLKRLEMHLKNVKEAENGKRNWNKRLSWIKSLNNKNLIPIIEELDICNSKKDACELEIYWIEQFINWGFSLVNMTKGGDGGNVNINKSKEEMIEIGKKISIRNSGKKRSVESINKFRETIKSNGHWLSKPGAVSPCKGKTTSKETREKQSKAKLGKSLSLEHRINLCGRIPINKNKSKYPNIIQYSLNDIELMEFKTAGEAVIYLKLDTSRQSEIIRCCKGITKKALGYKWKFKIKV